MTSVAEQLMTAREALAPVAGELAGLEARLLAQKAWGVTPELLVRDAGRPAENLDIATFQSFVARRLKHEPIAQILGHKHFWKDDFIVTKDTLTPRADSETIIELCLKLKPQAARLLDLGTGTGCLLLSLLREYPDATGVAVDRSPAALAVAQENAKSLGLAPRTQFILSHWCEKLDKSASFDMVVTNPPYIPRAAIATLDMDVRDHEPALALDGGTDGLDEYRSILAQLAPHLAKDALVVCEVGMDQAAEVAGIARNEGFDVAHVAKDLAGTERAVALTQRTKA